MKNNEMIDFTDILGTAFELLGFNAADDKNFKDTCKEKVCQCKDNLAKKVGEKKEDIKKVFQPLVNFSNTDVRERIDDGKYSLQIIATGYDETMVKIQVNPNDRTLAIQSDVDVDAVWYMPNINMTVNLPEGIRYDSLKKDIRNGVITITGIVDNVVEANTFAL
jgi:HSP20 family molecular chaperone IbpA